MADTFKVVIKPSIQEVRASLAAKRKVMSDMGTLNANIATYLDRWVQKNFKTEGGKVGGWEAFAPSTLKKIAKTNRTPAKMLQDSGRLRSTFLPFADDKQAGIGTNLKSASGAPFPLYHQEGRGHLPQRRMLPEHAEVKKDIDRVVQRFARQVVKA